MKQGNNFAGLAIGIAALILFAAAQVGASQRFEVTGLLLQLDREHQTISVSCREIPGYMDAMTMSFPVNDSKLPQGLEPGMAVAFALVVDQQSSHAENLRIQPFESLELDPAEARRFKLMEKAMATGSNARDVLHVGQPVPNFTLLDQTRQAVSLSQFAGKVVAITFIYIRCPRPDYCVRLSNNLGILQRRFDSRMGRDLVLLTVIIDPDHDQQDQVENYARTWKANAHNWHFLTGSVDQVHQLCRKFDMAFYPDEGLLVHSFHTVIIDREGKLAANLDGNDFTAQQLGDLVQTVMAR